MSSGVFVFAMAFMITMMLEVSASDANLKELAAASNATASGVAIDVANFPDDVFREYVSTNFDTEEGTEGYLTEEEIVSAKKINLNGTKVADLTGVAFFVNLICKILFARNHKMSYM